MPQELFAAAGYFLPRLLFLNSRYAPQVHWGDIALALDGFPGEGFDLGSAAFWDEWRHRWQAQAERHERLAEAARTPASRSRALRGAAACYHWAEFMYFDDAGTKRALRRRIRDLTRDSLTGTDLRTRHGELPSPDGPVPYTLLLPPSPAASPLPCVVLSNGLDSVTEVEPLSLAEAYLERGIAALLFDGPGQGVNVGQTPLRIDMEQVVARLVDEVLRPAPEIDGERLAFLGVSFGGYLALRVAQQPGSAFRCVVNLSGGPRVAPFAGLPRRLKDDFRFALTGGLDRTAAPDAGLQARLDELALDPAVPAAVPVLSVHGALDDIFPLAALTEVDTAWSGNHQLVVHEREAHVCLNVIDACTQQAADWVADRLLAAAATDSSRTTERNT
ncbi:dienelactone hydrolase [Streptomyces fodineus]|uniref:Dienelactone hydrolase n=1 Tax=Streptomyces fodineus TaxID=1904616 RepID=A0A1D7YNL9_9ACTN|nr:dienelactone hydrolase [Streptomyces fodineus]